MLKQRNTKKQGDAGLGVAIGYFCEQGYTVCVPLTDSQDYDLVIEDHGGLKKVQVKTTRYTNPAGNFQVQLAVKGGNAKVNKIHKTGHDVRYDLLFIITENGDKYLIPKEDIMELKYNITLSDKYDRYKLLT